MMYILILTQAIESSHLISSHPLCLYYCAFFQYMLHFSISWLISFPHYLFHFSRYICFLGVKTTANHLPYHFVMIYILPAIFTAAVASSGIEFGYLDTSSAICSISSKEYKDVYFFYIPILVFSLVGLIAGKKINKYLFSYISLIFTVFQSSNNRFLFKFLKLLFEIKIKLYVLIIS